MPEQRLGILGGMGPQATQDFYQRILDRTDASCDQEAPGHPGLLSADSGPHRRLLRPGASAHPDLERHLHARPHRRHPGGRRGGLLPAAAGGGPPAGAGGLHRAGHPLQHLPLLRRPAPGGDLHPPHPHAQGDRGRAGGGGPEKGGHPGHRRHRPDRHLPEGVRRPGD